MRTMMMKDIYGENVVVDTRVLEEAYWKMKFEDFYIEIEAAGYKLVEWSNWQEAFDTYVGYYSSRIEPIDYAEMKVGIYFKRGNAYDKSNL